MAKKPRVINSERFERIRSSGRKERYLDKWTGQEVSRRFATQATTGMKIEERQRLLREERAAIQEERKTRAKPLAADFPLLERHLEKIGFDIKGEDSEAYRELKRELREIKRDNPDGWRSKWVERLYEEYDRDAFEDFDFHAFFGSPTTGE